MKYVRAMSRRVALRLCSFVAGAFVLVAGFSGCKKVPPPQQHGPLPVNVVTVVEKEVSEWDEFTGRMEAVESVEIRPRVSGYIMEIQFKAGAIVKKGDPLFLIDPRPYQADFDKAVADVERAQAMLELAKIDLERAKELRASKIIAASEFDQKAAALTQASAAARGAEAAKSSAALNLEFTQVRSPIEGRVSNERITVGNLVQPGAGAESVLTTVVSIDPIYVLIDADENLVLKYVRLNDEGKRKTAREAQLPAFVELGNETGFPHEGVIDFVDNRLDPGTGTMRARVILKSWNPLLAPGFFARVRVAGGLPFKATLIEDKVISSQQGVKFVFVVRPDNTIERRNIQTATMWEGLRIVKSGLKDGDKVVSTRLQILQPGMPVMPLPETRDAAAKPSAADAKPKRNPAGAKPQPADAK